MSDGDLQWSLVDVHPMHGRTFRRPLDTAECGFFWDGLFNGTADNVQHVALRLVDPRAAHLFSQDNIVRAWLSTKRRYPLVGACIEDVEWGPQAPAPTATDRPAWELASQPHFVVRERNLAVRHPGEIVFGTVRDAAEARRHAEAILDGPRPLSDALLVQLYAFRQACDGDDDDGEGTRGCVLHVMMLTAHCITDGVANHTLLRCFLDVLARDAEPTQLPLEERLAMVVPSLVREPPDVRGLSLARRRWRNAMGAVILGLRVAKRQGGHTLPGRFTHATPYVPAVSRHLTTALTLSQTRTVLANCRQHGLTFGNAFLPLAQVAMTRVLYRRYLTDAISEAEWAYRKRVPYFSRGPLNLRPHLDRGWVERGGGGEVMLSIGFFDGNLPFMTLGKDAPGRALVDGAPPLSELLTFNRFVHRAGMVQKQVSACMSHPLFFEIVRAMSLARLKRTQHVALQWMRRAAGEAASGADDAEVLAVTDLPFVLAHGGSSIGNVEVMFPSEYPLPSSHPLSPDARAPHPLRAGYVGSPSSSSSSLAAGSNVDVAPTVVVEDVWLRLHTRPAELYLGASALRGQLRMFVFYDGNVYEDGVIKEWLDEVRAATVWYLGRTHREGDERDRGVEAKL